MQGLDDQLVLTDGQRAHNRPLYESGVGATLRIDDKVCRRPDGGGRGARALPAAVSPEARAGAASSSAPVTYLSGSPSSSRGRERPAGARADRRVLRSARRRRQQTVACLPRAAGRDLPFTWACCSIRSGSMEKDLREAANAAIQFVRRSRKPGRRDVRGFRLVDSRRALRAAQLSAPFRAHPASEAQKV